MKSLLPVLFCGMMSVTLYGQGFAVSADKINVAYEGVDNPLTVVVENCNCDNLVVSTDNGKLVKSGDRCGYLLSLAKPGIANITVQRKDGAKTQKLGTVKYRVKLFPPPTARLSYMHGGEMDIARFKVSMGITAQMDGFDFEAMFPIRRFKISFVRDKLGIFSAVNSGALFEEKVKAFFDNIKKGDKVVFSDIFCVYPWGRETSLESFEILLK